MNYEGILDNIVELASDKLTDWETKFVNNVLDQDYPLTDPQKEIILKIQNKYLKH